MSESNVTVGPDLIPALRAAYYALHDAAKRSQADGSSDDAEEQRESAAILRRLAGRIDPTLTIDGAPSPEAQIEAIVDALDEGLAGKE